MAQEGWKIEQEEGPCSPPAAAPSLCLNSCGFFGSAATMNLCSSCYKTLVLLKPKSPAQIPPPPPEQEDPKNEPDLSPPSSSSASSAEAMATSASAGLPFTEALLISCEKAQPPPRCFACQKKVGLRGFKCRCGDVFCSIHRYSDKHTCSFDYKAAGRASIAKANPLVKADKLQRI